MSKDYGKIQSVKEEIRQLENHRKILLSKKSDAERKVRTHRLIERGAILESVFPSAISLSNEKVRTFLSDISRLPEVQEKLKSKQNAR